MKALADNFEGKKFNSPNDITIDEKGRWRTAQTALTIRKLLLTVSNGLR